jgi:hypothetical protein
MTTSPLALLRASNTPACEGGEEEEGRGAELSRAELFRAGLSRAGT